MNDRHSSISTRTLTRATLAICVPAAALIGATTAKVDTQGVDTDAMLDVSVSIETVSHVSIDSFGDSVWRSGAGSGFLVSKAPCTVWTNHHVVDGAAVVRVRARGADDSMLAKVVSATARPDLAVLEVDNCDGMRVARMGHSDDLRVGQRVYAVGNPFGRNPDSVSSGIISHLERYTSDTVPYLQTDASINPGNSGGALFDAAGRVVGVNTAIAANSKGASASGVGYALPVTLAIRTARALEAGEHGWGGLGLGAHVSNLSAYEASLLGYHGGAAVVVMSEPADGPAAGLLAPRDLIVQFNGRPVTTRDSLLRLTRAHLPGSDVELGVLRGQQVLPVTVTLDDAGEPGTGEALAKGDGSPWPGHLGMTLETWLGRDDEVGHIGGPVISRVHDLGPAHIAGIVSSQRGVQRNGPFMRPVQLSVSRLTGVVLDGKYHAVEEASEVESLGRSAYEQGHSLLVEIELWTRSKNEPGESLNPSGRAFFALSPRPKSSEPVALAMHEEAPDE